MNKDLETMAMEFEKIKSELELALKHCEISANHFRKGEVRRACAHAFSL